MSDGVCMCILIALLVVVMVSFPYIVEREVRRERKRTRWLYDDTLARYEPTTGLMVGSYRSGLRYTGNKKQEIPPHVVRVCGWCNGDGKDHGNGVPEQYAGVCHRCAGRGWLDVDWEG